MLWHVSAASNSMNAIMPKHTTACGSGRQCLTSVRVEHPPRMFGDSASCSVTRLHPKHHHMYWYWICIPAFKVTYALRGTAAGVLTSSPAARRGCGPSWRRSAQVQRQCIKWVVSYRGDASYTCCRSAAAGKTRECDRGQTRTSNAASLKAKGKRFRAVLIA